MFYHVCMLLFYEKNEGAEKILMSTSYSTIDNSTTETILSAEQFYHAERGHSGGKNERSLNPVLLYTACPLPTPSRRIDRGIVRTHKWLFQSCADLSTWPHPTPQPICLLQCIQYSFSYLTFGYCKRGGWGLSFFGGIWISLVSFLTRRVSLVFFVDALRCLRHDCVSCMQWSQLLPVILPFADNVNFISYLFFILPKIANYIIA